MGGNKIPLEDMNSPTLRPAFTQDSEAIAALLTQLGYPADPADIPDRLVRLETFNYAETIVAELDGKVVGVITGHLFPAIHMKGLAAWITALVTAESARRRGVGAMLVAAIEEWARMAGAEKIAV